MPEAGFARPCTAAALARITGGILLPSDGPPTPLIRRVCTDSRTVQPGDAFLALRGERFDGHRFVAAAREAGAAAVIVAEPPAKASLASSATIRVSEPLDALGRIAAWHRDRRAEGCYVVGITGTNGKTTTKEITAQLLREPTLDVQEPGDAVVATRANENNRVGVPQTLLRIGARHRAAVIELGSNAAGEIPALAAVVRPDIGVLTNSSASHLEGLGDEAGVIEEETALLEQIAAGGVGLINADCPSATRARARAAAAGRSVQSFGIEAPADWAAKNIRPSGAGMAFTLQSPHEDRLPAFVPLPGRYNVRNALSAVAITAALGVPLAQAVERLARVTPPAMRSRVHPLLGGAASVTEDCYNANPASMRAALQTLAERPARRRIALLGEMAELGAAAQAYHEAIGREVATLGIDIVVTTGSAAVVLGHHARIAGATHITSGDAAEAGELLATLLEPGDAVLVKGSRCNRLELALEELLAADTQRRRAG